MTRQVSVVAASLCLQHVPNLVRYGSKPTRSAAAFAELGGRLRTFDQAVAYPPNQVFIGRSTPESLWDMPRPWWGAASGHAAKAGDTNGPFGEILDQAAFYDLLRSIDRFGLIRDTPDASDKDCLPLSDGDRVAGFIHGDHRDDQNLTPSVLLENLAAKAGGVHAVRHLLGSTGIDPSSVTFVIGAGEEAIGDRYQRGGGGFGKAVAEETGLVDAAAYDLKAFCAAPVHALATAASSVATGADERVLIVAGGSLAKLGMKFEGAIRADAPILEDVLASMAILVEPEGHGPILRLDALGRHRVGSGSSQQALLTDLIERPLDRLGLRMTDIGRYATELHNPEITEPSLGGDVPERNYRMMGAMAVLRSELDASEVPEFAKRYGLPGFSPTQGHIASAIPWLPHALARFRDGELSSTMLIAKGSLFLGRLTRLWDGASVTLEAQG
jgi:betaine reductase